VTLPNSNQQNRAANVLGAARTTKQSHLHMDSDAHASVESMGIKPSNLPSAEELQGDPDDETDVKVGTELKTIKEIKDENEHTDFEKDKENKQMVVYGPHPENHQQASSRDIPEPPDIESKIAQVTDIVGSMFSEGVIRVALKHNNYNVSDHFVSQLFELDPEKIAQYEKEAATLPRKN